MRYPKAFAVIAKVNLILGAILSTEIQKEERSFSIIIIFVISTILIYRCYSKIRFTNEQMKIQRNLLEKMKEKENREKWN